MFALSIITMGFGVCIVILDICAYKIADHVEKLEKQLEEMKRRKR